MNGCDLAMPRPEAADQCRCRLSQPELTQRYSHTPMWRDASMSAGISEPVRGRFT